MSRFVDSNFSASAEKAICKKRNKGDVKGQRARYKARYPEKYRAQKRTQKKRARARRREIGLPAKKMSAARKAKSLSRLQELRNRPGYKAAARKARKLAEAKRVPPWAKTPAQRKAIAAFYAEARWLTRETGTLHVVDHIYPLRGETVSGLHVAENLRVVPESTNLAKGAMDPIAFMLS